MRVYSEFSRKNMHRCVYIYIYKQNGGPWACAFCVVQGVVSGLQPGPEYTQRKTNKRTLKDYVKEPNKTKRTKHTNKTQKQTEPVMSKNNTTKNTKKNIILQKPKELKKMALLESGAKFPRAPENLFSSYFVAFFYGRI